MKTIKPIYSEQSLKHERTVVFVLLITLASILLFGSVALAGNPPHAKAIAENQNNTTVLKWSYSADIQYTSFLVERSQDGVHYSFVSSVKIDGIVNSTNLYTTIDSNPLQGTTYYRISETNYENTPVILFQTKFSTNTALNKN